MQEEKRVQTTLSREIYAFFFPKKIQFKLLAQNFAVGVGQCEGEDLRARLIYLFLAKSLRLTAHSQTDAAREGECDLGIGSGCWLQIDQCVCCTRTCMHIYGQ